MNSLAKIFSRATSKNAVTQSSPTLLVESLEERQMLSTVDIIAAGATGQETVELIIEGETVAVFENVGGDFNNFEFVTLSYSTDEVIDPAGIEVAFTNDLYDPENGIDRNVFIDYILVDTEANGVVNEESSVTPANSLFRFESEDPTVFSTGTWGFNDGITPGFGRGQILHSNGSFTYDGTTNDQGNLVGATPNARGSVIKMNVRGDTGFEQFNLRIDGKVVQTYDATTELSEYRFVSEDVISADQVRIEFTNDYYDPANGIDSNLIVSSIRVNSRLFQTEAPTTFSTGVYQEGQGIVSGFNETETLSTNGFFEYLAGESSLQFAGEDWTSSSDSSQVFVSDGVLTVRGTPDTIAVASRTFEVTGDRLYNLSFDAYRDIISGSFASDSQPWGTIGVNFNDADGNIVSQSAFGDIARDSQSDGFRSRELFAPANAVSATIWIWAGLTNPGVEIPLRVRDVQLTRVNPSNVTPPTVRLVANALTAPASTLQFTLEVTDDDGLRFVNGPIPEVTIVGPGDFSVDLNSIAGTGIDGGTAFFYELPPISGDQWTSADNGVYLVVVNEGAFSDSLGNLVEETPLGVVPVIINS